MSHLTYPKRVQTQTVAQEIFAQELVGTSEHLGQPNTYVFKCRIDSG